MADKPSEKNGRFDTGLIRELAAILREADLGEIEIEQGGTRIKVVKPSRQGRPDGGAVLCPRSAPQLRPSPLLQPPAVAVGIAARPSRRGEVADGRHRLSPGRGRREEVRHGRRHGRRRRRHSC
jgi:acetyl-CoA carboxylase biotin carboxyl carrier protein